MALKTTIRYSLIIFTLVLFSSCAEPFNEMEIRRYNYYF